MSRSKFVFVLVASWLGKQFLHPYQSITRILSATVCRCWMASLTVHYVVAVEGVLWCRRYAANASRRAFEALVAVQLAEFGYGGWQHSQDARVASS